MKENKLITCKCGRKFRQYGIDRKGNNREYTECMNCHIENIYKQTDKYSKR